MSQKNSVFDGICILTTRNYFRVSVPMTSVLLYKANQHSMFAINLKSIY